MSRNIKVPCSTTNQSAVYVTNAVSSLEITADGKKKITSKVESRGVTQDKTVTVV